MHARVATFELADPSKIDQEIESMRQESGAGPPEGIPAKEFLVMVDKPGGKVISITLFETEEDLRKGDETLNSMSPGDSSAMGRRTSVEMFEVPLHMG
jgi:uncharacterized protein YcgI (DUF1989 family)